MQDDDAMEESGRKTPPLHEKLGPIPHLSAKKMGDRNIFGNLIRGVRDRAQSSCLNKAVPPQVEDVSMNGSSDVRAHSTEMIGADQANNRHNSMSYSSESSAWNSEGMSTRLTAD